MTAKIHKIGVGEVEVAEAIGDPEVVAQLEWLLDRARKGTLTAFSMVLRDEETIGTVSRGSWRGGFFEALGVMHTLLFDMTNGSQMTNEPGSEPRDLGA